MPKHVTITHVLTILVLTHHPAAAADVPLPDAKPVPVMQVIPLPYDQASFQHSGSELTRYHFGPSLRRPFWYPLIGPAGRSLTRMGHPRDPHTHSHHNSVWISHNDVGGADFWGDHGKNNGRIVHRWVRQYEDGQQSAWMLSLNAWQNADGKVLLNEWRRCEVEPLGRDGWLMLVDLQFEAPASSPVVLGQTPFGMIGVRMAKTIGVADGGGRILNSRGHVNEQQVFRKPARWVDYSGRVTDQLGGGITLMDHPQNPGHPAPFHVRNDGWMGACLTLGGPLSIEPAKPLRLHYGLWIHSAVPPQAQIENLWRHFARRPLAPMPAAE